jgi:DNA-binding transcriptional LysR family regulator
MRANAWSGFSPASAGELPMHKRHQHVNIPIEIVRSVVAISETGSLCKAADRLGLSQPAVSSQVKRLQNLVGGSLFVRTANGTTTTELGKLALQLARRILDANDQLLRLGGNNFGSQPLRLGLSPLFVDEFIKHQNAESLSDIFVHTDQSTSIGRGLVEGYIDVACIYGDRRMDAEVEQTVVNECDDPLVWIRARNFVLSPGAPLPVLAYPGDEWMIPTLAKFGLSYKIVFNSADYHARLSAVAAGVGLTSVPASRVPAHLIQANEYYLPRLPPVKALLCARSGLETGRAMELMKELSALFFRAGRVAGKDGRMRNKTVMQNENDRDREETR